MMERNKIYFASDFHLGVPDFAASREREDKIVRWLDMIKADASEIYLMGDLFDFWFEYPTVIPKGFIRFQGKLAELTDSGIKVVFFKGNHDMWMFDYFTKEMGIEIISDELIIERGGKKFYLHHGDGLGPGDSKYKLIKKFFRSKVCQWMFRHLHPSIGMGIATKWSHSSRLNNFKKEVYCGEDAEWLIIYSKEILKKEHFDYFIYGHRHLPLDVQISPDIRYINLGEWTNYYSYAVFDGINMELKYFEGNHIHGNLQPQA